MRKYRQFHPGINYQTINKKLLPFRLCGVICSLIGIILLFTDISAGWTIILWAIAFGMFSIEVNMFIVRTRDGYRVTEDGITYWRLTNKHILQYSDIQRIYIVNTLPKSTGSDEVPGVYLIKSSMSNLPEKKTKNKLYYTEITSILADNRLMDDNYLFIWNEEVIHYIFRNYQGRYYVAQSVVDKFPDTYEQVCEQYCLKERVLIVKDT